MVENNKWDDWDFRQECGNYKKVCVMSKNEYALIIPLSNEIPVYIGGEVKIEVGIREFQGDWWENNVITATPEIAAAARARL